MRTLGLLSLVFALVAGAVAGWAYNDLQTPVGGTQLAHVTVKAGSTLHPVLKSLQEQGVLAHPNVLYAFARLRRATTVRSGAYEVGAEQTPLAILAMLLEGRVMLESLTVAEGFNRWQVRALLAQGGWVAAAQFDRLCDDRQFLASHGIPGPSCEGYLYPETYKFARGVAPATVLQTMFAAFTRAVTRVRAQVGSGPLALPLREFTTLASIVEKETGQPLERPHIACVFYNRLRATPAWKLETDPTVIYAATLADAHFDGNLTRAHLRSLESPYNTYREFGLPPGPIASPGEAALSAVGRPDPCPDFFFVSTNNGQHVFCPTLACHNRAVQKWQVDYFHRARRAGGPPQVR